jgi:diamine N-acetyltransferase
LKNVDEAITVELVLNKYNYDHIYLSRFLSLMNSFQFKEGSSELLAFCTTLWELFISNQAQNAGEMSVGVEEYIHNLQNNGLLQKTQDGKLQVQLVFVGDQEDPIGFCVTSLTKERVGEVEALFVLDRYQGNKLGGQLFQNALAWMEKEGSTEQRLVVAVGNEKVFDFYARYGFFPGYSTLFRVT